MKKILSFESLMGKYKRYDFNRSDFITAGLVFVVSLITYGYSLTPSVAAGDNGELTSAMFYLGLGHAPGYPIHSMFGKLMTFLPWGGVAWKANFFSAFSGALTIYFSCLVYLKMVQSLGSDKVFAIFSAVVGSLVFLTSNSLWGQSITTEVYSVSAIFHPLLLLILLKWKDEVISMTDVSYLYLGERFLLVYGFVLGVATGGHQTVVLVQFMVLFVLIFILYHFQMKPRKKLEAHFETGFLSFLFVVFNVLVGWFFYYKYIVSLKSNLFTNANINTKIGVWGFVIPHLIILIYYVVFRYFYKDYIRRDDFFQRLSFFIVKFMGMFFLGFSVYLYLFIRSHGDPPINWGGISESTTVWGKIAKFFTMINRKQFAASAMPRNLYTIFIQFKLVLVNLHLQQFALAVYPFMLLGIVKLLQHGRFFLMLLIIGFSSYVLQLTLFLNADFRSRDLFFIEVFYIFSYFMMSCLVPLGVVFVLEWFQNIFSLLKKSEIKN